MIQNSMKTKNQICAYSNLLWILFWIQSTRQNVCNVKWRNDWLRRAGRNSTTMQKKAEALQQAVLLSRTLSSPTGAQRAAAFQVNNPIRLDSCLVSIHDEFRPSQMSCRGEGNRCKLLMIQQFWRKNSEIMLLRYFFKKFFYNEEYRVQWCERVQRCEISSFLFLSPALSHNLSFCHF